MLYWNKYAHAGDACMDVAPHVQMLYWNRIFDISRESVNKSSTCTNVVLKYNKNISYFSGVNELHMYKCCIEII